MSTGEAPTATGNRNGSTRPAKSEPDALVRARLRLRLALFAMAILPVALVVVLLSILLDPEPRQSSLLGVALLIPLTVFLLGFTVWMTRPILAVLQALHRSTHEFSQMYEAARSESLRDGLTGLGNHRAFQEELDRAFEMLQRYKMPVALLLMDLDDLKMINDLEGHAAGDDVLRTMGRMIAEVARYTDRAFRVGGDEFALLMPHTDASGALHVARRLQSRALEPVAGKKRIPFSGGISASPQLATTRTQLYAQADAALYWCKRHGRASVEVFDPVRDRQASLQVTTELSTAVARVVSEHLLRPVYQPIVHLTTGRVLGVEGLIRPSPDSGFSDAGSMFVAAEAVGRTVELDLACLSAVVAGARALPAEQVLSLNVSPRTAEAAHFSAQGLLAILDQNGISPGRVVVEVTERETVEDIGRLQANLAALQQAGVRIAADDVGAGNAGLKLLSQIRFDIFKIDLTLVQQGAEQDPSHAVLRSLRDLAARFQAAVIAEGIETVGQLQMVRELGLSAGQGFLLGRPNPNPIVATVDLPAIEAGRVVLERRSASDPFVHSGAGVSTTATGVVSPGA